MVKEDVSLIKVKVSTKTKLKKLKIHPRQSYDEVINELLENQKEKKK